MGQMPVALQSAQSSRVAGGALQLPLVASQNWPSAQYWFVRQNCVHWWLWQEFFVVPSNAQSPVVRQPGLHEAVTASQI
jgi:hypothetical protein